MRLRGSAHRMGGAWWKLSGGYGRCEVVRLGRCVQSGFVLPHGRVCFGQGESPVKLFAKLFGKSAREGSDNATSRHRVQPSEAEGQDGERPLFRDQVTGPGGDISGGQGAPSVDPAQSGRIGFGEPSASGTGGGFASDPYASNAPAGQPRQEDPSMSALVCTRCGNRNAENSRFCSNCGAPLRAARPPSVRPRRLPRSPSPASRPMTPRSPARPSCRRSPPRPRPPSTRCRSARRCWSCAAVRTRAAASCWTAI